MQLNAPRPPVHTHEGATAQRTGATEELRRAISCYMLWEKQYYETGHEIAGRVIELARTVDPGAVRELALMARWKMKLRHAPLLLLATLAEHGGLSCHTVEKVIGRADELSELLAIYWRDGKKPLKKSLKHGLAAAFRKFNEYQLSKYDRANAIRLRDVLFLCHAKPQDAEQDALWKRLIANQLQVPDTWEVALSAGAGKKATWERLISEKKLGSLAVLRNLRNMVQAGVDPATTIQQALDQMSTERVLPFRFIAAARAVPQLEPYIESTMLRCLTEQPRLTQDTILLVDVSASMNDKISDKSDLTRMDAGAALAILVRDISDRARIFTFSNDVVEVPARRGFALRDAVVQSQVHSGTYLGKAIAQLPSCRRLIVITDEQSHDAVGTPNADISYIVNVASYQYGVAYDRFVHINGWSEAVLDFIREHEAREISEQQQQQQDQGD